MTLAYVDTSCLVVIAFDEVGARLLSGLTWVYPNRPLTRELDRVIATGYLKGADLWHLACALFLAPDGKDLTFATLDRRQEEVAARLRFAPWRL
jgi:hypothetical protein